MRTILTQINLGKFFGLCWDKLSTSDFALTRAGSLAALLFWLSDFLTIWLSVWLTCCLSDWLALSVLLYVWLSCWLCVCLDFLSDWLPVWLSCCLHGCLSAILLTFWTLCVLITMLTGGLIGLHSSKKRIYWYFTGKVLLLYIYFTLVNEKIKTNSRENNNY